MRYTIPDSSSPGEQVLMEHRLHTLIIAILWVAKIHSTLAEEASHRLDGMTFVGNNGEKGRELDPDEHEEIVFEKGRFRSVSCEPYHFGDSAYSTKVIGKTIYFEASQPVHRMAKSFGEERWKVMLNRPGFPGGSDI
jgi:hypothetical protein